MVPLAMEPGSPDVDLCQLVVADFHNRFGVSGIDGRLDDQPGFSRGVVNPP